MKTASFIYMAAFAAAISAALPARSQSVPVAKTNPMKVYMHYMPWFETPATLGGSNWGYHWKFNNQNPNILDASGKRHIASHYYPKIGPYASSDPNVIEYHMLLMKYSGVDGILIDWYGVQGTNGDVGSLLNNSNAAIAKVDDFGLRFGVVMEDRFSTVSSSNLTPDINKGKANMAYLRDNYFNNPNYIRQNATNDPLVGVFGPIRFQTELQWTQILAEAGEDVDFNTLWYEKNDAGTNADGEYAWIYEDGSLNNHLSHQSNFYRFRAPTLGTVGGVAYPGFDDFYQEGGTGTVIGFDIPHNNGQTLTDVLNLVSQNSASMDYLQLATFNDFGEGTMFEPTVETGFNYLHQLQLYTGTSYGIDELQLIYQLYLARKEYAGNASKQALLDQVAADLSAVQVSDGRTLLSQASPPGDYNGDGLVNMSDYNVWRTAFGTSTIIYGSGSDGDYNGSINIGDYLVWRKDFAAGAAGVSFAVVPEPTSSSLLVLAALLLCRCAIDRHNRTS
jgi:Glycosyl hydrolase family 99